jgi:hypothetical protein
MKVWSDLTKQTHKSHNKLRKLNLIGTTRWWSKDKTLSSIIQFNKPIVKDSRFLLFIYFLLEITSSDSTFDAKTKYTTHTLIQNWSKFEIILTVAIYLDIFTISTPVSKFLQSRSLNYLIVFNMTSLVKQIKGKRNNGDETFNKLISNVQNFITKIHQEFELNSIDFIIKDKFSKNKCVNRVPKIKKIPGELTSDERPDLSAEKRFKVETYNFILDIMINIMKKRFVNNSELLKDCICLDSKNFKNIKSCLPEN